MQTRTCGSTGLTLPVLGVGVWSFGGTSTDYWGSQDDRDAAEVVARAIDLGANYFDTAEMYNEGHSEEALGRALRGRRAEALVGSKVSPDHTAPAVLRAHCEATLRRLGTDYLDLYMVHWPVTEGSAADTFGTLAALQGEGKIRHIGVSNFGPQQLTEALASLGSAGATGGTIAVNQLPYSLLSRAIEMELLPFCVSRGIGVIAYMPLMQGLLTGKYHTIDEIPPRLTRTRHFRGDRPGARHGEAGAEAETLAVLDGLRDVAARLDVPVSHVALAWTVAHPEITCTIAGARNTAQLEDNVRGASLRLSASVLNELDALSYGLMQKLGPNVDMWQNAEHARTK
jgi:aryl-alcohol dehydrogenase-like predicted oxidoreductase